MTEKKQKPKTRHIFDLKKKIYIKNLIKTRGHFSNACKLSKICYQTLCDWKRNCPEFVQAITEVDDTIIDHVESRLHDCIDDGDASLIKFYLERKAKQRGYADEKHITHAIDLDNLDEVLDAASKRFAADY